MCSFHLEKWYKMSKYNNILLSIILTAIVATVLINILHQYRVARSCPSSKWLYESLCNPFNIKSKEEFNYCWCAENM